MKPEEDNKRVRSKTPTTDDYVDALKQVVRPESTFMRMLEIHYKHPERNITSDAMSAAMKYKGRFDANLPYAMLGRLVGRRLGWLPEHPINVLVHFRFPEPERKCHWRMRGRLAEALERLRWFENTSQDVELNPDEIPEEVQLFEGAVRRVKVNAYERSREARRQCLAHYGTWCMVCGFNFERAYGKAAKGFIHVHHIRLLNEIGKEYRIDPIRDLRPVCPNCHAVIHSNPRPYTIRKVREMVAAHRPANCVDPPEVREARLRQPVLQFSHMTPK